MIAYGATDKNKENFKTRGYYAPIKVNTNGDKNDLGGFGAVIIPDDAEFYQNSWKDPQTGEKSPMILNGLRGGKDGPSNVAIIIPPTASIEKTTMKDGTKVVNVYDAVGRQIASIGQGMSTSKEGNIHDIPIARGVYTPAPNGGSYLIMTYDKTEPKIELKNTKNFGQSLGGKK